MNGPINYYKHRLVSCHLSVVRPGTNYNVFCIHTTVVKNTIQCDKTRHISRQLKIEWFNILADSKRLSLLFKREWMSYIIVDLITPPISSLYFFFICLIFLTFLIVSNDIE